MTRKLPEYIVFRRERVGSGFLWRYVCKACGVSVGVNVFWQASEAAYEHAAWHRAEEEGSPVTSAGAPG
jgi:hypothetical protein